MDNILGKAKGALDKFMGDPQKVDKAKRDADKVLGKHMDQEKADKMVDGTEDLLDKAAEHPE